MSGNNRYRCTVCSYVYKPEKGDWTQEIEKGTPFAALPDFWHCPTCGQNKLAFVRAE